MSSINKFLNKRFSARILMNVPKSQRIALIYPPVIDRCLPMRDLGLSPPLHLLSLAAYIGNEVKIFDGAHDSLDDIISGIDEFTPDVIGMNVDLTNYENAIKIANNSESRVILGGNYAAFLANQILNNQKRVDAICYNDGEEALMGFIQGNYSVPNLISRKGRSAVKLMDISKHPTPAYHLVDMNRYFQKQKDIFGPNFKMMQFYGQKGCLNSPHCTFCGRYEDGMRLRDPKIYSDEIKHYIEKYSLTEVWDRSDSYLQSKKWFSSVHSNLRGLPVSFKTYARADQLSNDNIMKMKEMNFRMIYIGYEAGEDTILELMNKKENTRQYLDATRRVLDSGIDIDASFIIGLPGEDKRTLEKQIEFVSSLSQLGLNKIKVNRVLVLPGTPLYDRVCQKNEKIRVLDCFDNSMMQRYLYSTYDLSDFGSVDNFISSIDETATQMLNIIQHKGGCIEGYGYNKMINVNGKETWK